jgi:hypothetical protein
VFTLSASMIVMVWPSMVNVKLGSRFPLSKVGEREREYYSPHDMETSRILEEISVKKCETQSKLRTGNVFQQ